MKPYYKGSGVTLYQGDALSVLREMETGSVNCVVTSPPYWRMRDYHVDGQLGMESAPEEYIDVMVGVFDEVKRVLRDDGTVWINIGDCYASGGWGTSGRGMGHFTRTWKEREKMSGWRSPPRGLKCKDMVGIPWRLAFALQAAGWYLRSEIIWQKPNVLPESISDRPAKSHEKIFLLSKKPKYYYDAEAVKVEASENTHDRGTRIRTKVDGANKKHNRANHSFLSKIGRPLERRNLRDVWTVPTKSYKGSHFATFPPDLIRPCILAGCPRGGTVLDPFVGSGTSCFVSKELRRRSVGIDLSSDYLDLAARRLSQEVLVLGG